MTAQLRARSLSFNRGPLAILADVELTMTPGQRLGVVGPNGTGKSTLLQLLAGQLSPSSGRVSLQPPDATVVLLDQEILAPLGRVDARVSRPSGWRSCCRGGVQCGPRSSCTRRDRCR